MTDEQWENLIVIVGAIILVSLFGSGIWWFFIRLDHIEIMSIRSKSWYREVQELEDYQEWVCHNRTKTDCSGDDCETKHYRDCGWETKARLINKWIKDGIYPDSPKWPEYNISSGHYGRSLEIYTINFSNDKETWPYKIYNESDYDTYTVRGKCKVGLNYFNFILFKEC